MAMVDISARLGEIPMARQLTEINLIDNHPMLSAECSDDVIVVGFPHGYYDELNHYPIVKRGIVASAWGADFDGEPFFLIDAKLFPGSSGSAVLTKPVEYVHQDGKLHRSPTGKQFALLGVYSGEPELVSEDDPEYADVGIVLYASLMAVIIADRTAWTDSSSPTISLGTLRRPTRRKAKS